MMTPTLLANLREDPDRCWYCGAHPPTQGHDPSCSRPNPSRYITRCPPRPQEARQGPPVGTSHPASATREDAIVAEPVVPVPREEPAGAGQDERPTLEDRPW